MLKCDGSLQVHGRNGVKPVNWQPRTDEIIVREDDGRAVLVAERFKPDEMVRIVFLEPALALAIALRDLTGFQLHGSEAQLQAALARHPELIEPDLTVLERELLVGVGGIDLYARDAQGRKVVVELKRGKCTQEAVHQLERYVQAVRSQVPGEVRGILAGASITAPARRQLERSGLQFVEVTSLPIEADEPDQVALF
jgi:RecB family endonuclease NucS